MRRPRWQVWLADKKVLARDFKRYLRERAIRKIRPSAQLSRNHLDKAFHNLDFAVFTLENQDGINKRVETETYFDWVIVISYYAMYQSALALLYNLGYKSSAHLATLCVLCEACLGKELDEEDIGTLSKVLELREEEIKEIGQAKERRERASYSGSMSFQKHLAEMTLGDARKFINKIADLLGR